MAFICKWYQLPSSDFSMLILELTLFYRVVSSSKFCILAFNERNIKLFIKKLCQNKGNTGFAVRIKINFCDGYLFICEEQIIYFCHLLCFVIRNLRGRGWHLLCCVKWNKQGRGLRDVVPTKKMNMGQAEHINFITPI